MQHLIMGIWLLSLLALTGCSGGSSANVSPTNDAQAVFTPTEIRVTVPLALNNATVNGETVTILEKLDTTHLLPGSVTYDAESRTIVFKPVRRLSSNASYSVTLSGIKGIDGKTLATIVLASPSLLPPSSRVVQYNNGQVAGYVSYRYDTAGRRVLSVHYTDPGPDGVWFTADDVANDYISHTHDAQGNRTISTLYSSNGNVAGLDGVLFTADDVVNNYIRSSYDGTGHLLRQTGYFGPGPDGVWFTADDQIGSYTGYSYDAAGRRTAATIYEFPGPDGVWFTADDKARLYWIFNYGPDGFLAQNVNYYAGPDEIPHTADDTVLHYDAYANDAFGNQTRLTSYKGPGPDGVWFTADDEVSSYEISTTDASGNLLSSTAYDSPGPDRIWFTVDDYAESAKGLFSYDASGRMLRYARGSGLIGLSGSYWELITYSYAANGTPSREIVCSGPGPDGVRFSDDDPVSGYTDYIYDNVGNLLVETSYDTGPDGIPFNGDDRITGKKYYDSAT